MNTIYPNLYHTGTVPGVHKSNSFYLHPWLVVSIAGTFGFSTEEKAYAVWKYLKKFKEDDYAKNQSNILKEAQRRAESIEHKKQNVKG